MPTEEKNYYCRSGEILSFYIVSRTSSVVNKARNQLKFYYSHYNKAELFHSNHLSIQLTEEILNDKMPFKIMNILLKLDNIFIELETILIYMILKKMRNNLQQFFKTLISVRLKSCKILLSHINRVSSRNSVARNCAEFC